MNFLCRQLHYVNLWLSTILRITNSFRIELAKESTDLFIVGLIYSGFRCIYFSGKLVDEAWYVTRCVRVMLTICVLCVYCVLEENRNDFPRSIWNYCRNYLENLWGTFWNPWHRTSLSLFLSICLHTEQMLLININVIELNEPFCTRCSFNKYIITMCLRILYLRNGIFPPEAERRPEK